MGTPRRRPSPSTLTNTRRPKVTRTLLPVTSNASKSTALLCAFSAPLRSASRRCVSTRLTSWRSRSTVDPSPTRSTSLGAASSRSSRLVTSSRRTRSLTAGLPFPYPDPSEDLPRRYRCHPRMHQQRHVRRRCHRQEHHPHRWLPPLRCCQPGLSPHQGRCYGNPQETYCYPQDPLPLHQVLVDREARYQVHRHCLQARTRKIPDRCREGQIHGQARLQGQDRRQGRRERRRSQEKLNTCQKVLNQ